MIMGKMDIFDYIICIKFVKILIERDVLGKGLYVSMGIIGEKFVLIVKIVKFVLIVKYV